MINRSYQNLKNYYLCFLTDFVKGVNWDDVVIHQNENPVQLDLFVWPLAYYKRERRNQLLLKRSLEI